MTAQAAGPRPATSTLSMPSWAIGRPSRSRPTVRGAGPPRERLAQSAWPVRRRRAPRVRRLPARSAPGAATAPPARGEEGSDVQAWTQAALPQGEQGQPRQAAERVTTAPGASQRPGARSPAEGVPRSRRVHPAPVGGFRSGGSGVLPRPLRRRVADHGRRLADHALDGDLCAVLLEGDGGQLQLDPLAQAGRRFVSPAAAADQRLELLLDAELPEAGGAVLEVLGDHRAPGIVGLVVEELEHVRQDVAAGVDLDGLAGLRSVAAHQWLASSPAPARTKPRSRA